MSEEEFGKHVQALAVKRLDKPKRLRDECTKHWKEIISHQYNFDRGMQGQTFVLKGCISLDIRLLYWRDASL